MATVKVSSRAITKPSVDHIKAKKDKTQATERKAEVLEALLKQCAIVVKSTFVVC